MANDDTRDYLYLDTRNHLYLKAVLAAVEREAMAFYNGAGKGEEDYKDRFSRLKEIRNALKAINTPFSIAANDPYGCEPNVCKGGVCVDPNIPIDWPEKDDPSY